MTERRNQARGANEWADTYGNLGSSTPQRQIQLPLAALDPWQYPDGSPQIFKPYSRNRLLALSESIRKNGIIEAICVRPLPNGRFQIIAGHNRVSAAQLAGLTSVPALVRQISDGEAEDLLRDSNMQHRPVLLPSERAKAYHQVMEKISHRGKRTDLTLDNDCPKLPASSHLTLDNDCPKSSELSHSHQIIAEMYNVSRTSVKQYLRLLKLHPAILDMVDNEAQPPEDKDPNLLCMAFVAGYEITFLSENHQEALISVIKQTGKVPTPSQAKQLHKLSGQGLLDDAAILSILQPTKAPKAATVKLPAERIASFFPENTKPEDMEAEIYEALAFYRQHKTPASA